MGLPYECERLAEMTEPFHPLSIKLHKEMSSAYEYDMRPVVGTCTEGRSNTTVQLITYTSFCVSKDYICPGKGL